MVFYVNMYMEIYERIFLIVIFVSTLNISIHHVNSSAVIGNFVVLVAPVDTTHFHMISQLDEKIPVISISCSADNVLSKLSATYYVDLLCRPHEFVSNPNILLFELLKDNANSVSDADVALHYISQSVALLYDHSMVIHICQTLLS